MLPNSLPDYVDKLEVAGADEIKDLLCDAQRMEQLRTLSREFVDEVARERDPQQERCLHDMLARIHDRYFSKAHPVDSARDIQAVLQPVQTVLEDFYLAEEDTYMDMDACPSTSDPDDFVRELKDQVRAHPANRHDFYIDYLPNHADVGDIRFYLAQETALDPRFDDFIALMQLGCAPQQKMELAGNYWDEMGNGDPSRVHTRMFSQAMSEVGATDDYVRDNLLTETLVCGNLSALMSLNNRLYYRSIGSFAVTEFLFPRRCSQLLEAWKRNGFSQENGEYHREHIGIDARHASGFFRNVIKPEVAERPDAVREIYWGAMARMNSSNRYLDVLVHRLRENANRTLVN